MLSEKQMAAKEDFAMSIDAEKSAAEVKHS